MPYVPFIDLTDLQRLEARRLRPDWQDEEFSRFEFWLKPDGHVSRRFGHHQLTKDEFDKTMRTLSGEDVRSKGDLRGFKLGNSFHISTK